MKRNKPENEGGLQQESRERKTNWSGGRRFVRCGAAYFFVVSVGFFN